MSRRRKQLILPVRMYVVSSDGFGDHVVQAATPAQARWKTFKAAQDAGYFTSSGFRGFLQHGFRVREERR